MHFFRQRGYHVARPKFPLVGVVFYSKSQYQRYCSRALGSNVSNTYGVYMPDTNRIYLYDATQGAGKKSREWTENLATVMHEAAQHWVVAAVAVVVETGAGRDRWGAAGWGVVGVEEEALVA